jgi:hypothetical protein
MSIPTPMSPPTSSSDANPISPISRTSTFPHKTSPAVSSQTSHIDTNTPAINDAPVELDGSAVSTQVRGGSGGGAEGNKGGVLSSADEEDIDAEFSGKGVGKGSGRGVREVRFVAYPDTCVMACWCANEVGVIGTSGYVGFAIERPRCDCGCTAGSDGGRSAGCQQCGWGCHAGGWAGEGLRMDVR